MAFEEYIPRRVSSKQPAVTIGKTGLLMFNVSCVSEYLKDNKFVKLYYDSDTKRIGMKLFKEQVEHTVAVSKGKGAARNNATLSMKSFLNLHRILPKEGSLRALPCHYDTVLEMLVIQLP